MKSRVVVAKGEDFEVLVTIWDSQEIDVAIRGPYDSVWGAPLPITADVFDETDGDPPEPLVTTG